MRVARVIAQSFLRHVFGAQQGFLRGGRGFMAAERLVDGREPRLRFGRGFVVIDDHRVHGRRAAGHHALEVVDIHRAAASTAAAARGAGMSGA